MRRIGWGVRGRRGLALIRRRAHLDNVTQARVCRPSIEERTAGPFETVDRLAVPCLDGPVDVVRNDNGVMQRALGERMPEVTFAIRC
jgi:hypothetical protein